MISNHFNFLLVDVSATAFYEPISVVDFVAKYLNLGDPRRAASKTFSDSDQIKVVFLNIHVFVRFRKWDDFQ